MLIPLGAGASLRLEEESPRVNVDPLEPAPGLPEGWQASVSARSLDALSPADRPPFLFDAGAPERGINSLRLFEMRDYAWEIVYSKLTDLPSVEITSSLHQSSDRDLWKPRGKHGRFRFVNYLGSGWIEAAVEGHPPRRIPFEVASPKLDYEQEYRSMVEAIGEECQQLLLEWGSPTSLDFVVDPERQVQTLLEQFLFLRHVLGPDKLGLFLETISHQTHSRLERELNWKPASASDPALFASDPLRYG